MAFTTGMVEDIILNEDQNRFVEDVPSMMTDSYLTDITTTPISKKLEDLRLQLNRIGASLGIVNSNTFRDKVNLPPSLQSQLPILPLLNGFGQEKIGLEASKFDATIISLKNQLMVYKELIQSKSSQIKQQQRYLIGKASTKSRCTRRTDDVIDSIQKSEMMSMEYHLECDKNLHGYSTQILPRDDREVALETTLTPGTAVADSLYAAAAANDQDYLISHIGDGISQVDSNVHTVEMQGVEFGTSTTLSGTSGASVGHYSDTVLGPPNQAIGGLNVGTFGAASNASEVAGAQPATSHYGSAGTQSSSAHTHTSLANSLESDIETRRSNLLNMMRMIAEESYGQESASLYGEIRDSTSVNPNTMRVTLGCSCSVMDLDFDSEGKCFFAEYQAAEPYYSAFISRISQLSLSSPQFSNLQLFRHIVKRVYRESSLPLFELNNTLRDLVLLESKAVTSMNSNALSNSSSASLLQYHNLQNSSWINKWWTSEFLSRAMKSAGADGSSNLNGIEFHVGWRSLRTQSDLLCLAKTSELSLKSSLGLFPNNNISFGMALLKIGMGWICTSHMGPHFTFHINPISLASISNSIKTVLQHQPSHYPHHSPPTLHDPALALKVSLSKQSHQSHHHHRRHTTHNHKFQSPKLEVQFNSFANSFSEVSTIQASNVGKFESSTSNSVLLEFERDLNNIPEYSSSSWSHCILGVLRPDLFMNSSNLSLVNHLVEMKRLSTTNNCSNDYKYQDNGFGDDEEDEHGNRFSKLEAALHPFEHLLKKVKSNQQHQQYQRSTSSGHLPTFSKFKTKSDSLSFHVELEPITEDKSWISKQFGIPQTYSQIQAYDASLVQSQSPQHQQAPREKDSFEENSVDGFGNWIRGADFALGGISGSSLSAPISTPQQGLTTSPAPASSPNSAATAANAALNSDHANKLSNSPTIHPLDEHLHHLLHASWDQDAFIQYKSNQASASDVSWTSSISPPLALCLVLDQHMVFYSHIFQRILHITASQDPTTLLKNYWNTDMKSAHSALPESAISTSAPNSKYLFHKNSINITKKRAGTAEIKTSKSTAKPTRSIKLKINFSLTNSTQTSTTTCQSEQHSITGYSAPTNEHSEASVGISSLQSPPIHSTTEDSMDTHPSFQAIDPYSPGLALGSETSSMFNVIDSHIAMDTSHNNPIQSGSFASTSFESPNTNGNNNSLNAQGVSDPNKSKAPTISAQSCFPIPLMYQIAHQYDILCLSNDNTNDSEFNNHEIHQSNASDSTNPTNSPLDHSLLDVLQSTSIDQSDTLSNIPNRSHKRLKIGPFVRSLMVSPGMQYFNQTSDPSLGSNSANVMDTDSTPIIFPVPQQSATTQNPDWSEELANQRKTKALLVKKFVFGHMKQLRAIISLLRQQAILNDLYASCFSQFHTKSTRKVGSIILSKASHGHSKSPHLSHEIVENAVNKRCLLTLEIGVLEFPAIGFSVTAKWDPAALFQPDSLASVDHSPSLSTSFSNINKSSMDNQPNSTHQIDDKQLYADKQAEQLRTSPIIFNFQIHVTLDGIIRLLMSNESLKMFANRSDRQVTRLEALIRSTLHLPLSLEKWLS